MTTTRTEAWAVWCYSVTPIREEFSKPQRIRMIQLILSSNEVLPIQIIFVEFWNWKLVYLRALLPLLSGLFNQYSSYISSIFLIFFFLSFL